MFNLNLIKMKKSILILSFAVMAIVSVSLTSCSNSNKDSNESKVTEKTNVAEVKYQCPMKCEGDKTYNEPGKCPVCGMDLKEVK